MGHVDSRVVRILELFQDPNPEGRLLAEALGLVSPSNSALHSRLRKQLAIYAGNFLSSHASRTSLEHKAAAAILVGLWPNRVRLKDPGQLCRAIETLCDLLDHGTAGFTIDAAAEAGIGAALRELSDVLRESTCSSYARSFPSLEQCDHVLYDVLLDELGDEQVRRSPLRLKRIAACLTKLLTQHDGAGDLVSGLAVAAAEFSYRRCHVDRELRIAEELRRAADCEALLYQAKQDYRDHLMHASRVCSLGYLLLTARNRNCFNAETPDANVLKNWCTAALFHDLGYFLELYRLVFTMGERFASAHIQGLIESLSQVLVESTREMNIDAGAYGLRRPIGNRIDHAVVSFLHLRRLLADIDAARMAPLHAPESALETNYRAALTAVLKHNICTEPIETGAEPLSALLVVCDELQEWGRWRLGHGELNRSMLNYINYGAPPRLTYRRLADAVSFDEKTVQLCDGALRRLPNQEQIWLRIDYADQNENAFDPLVILLQKLFNLQRLHDTQNMRIGFELRFKYAGRTAGGNPAREIDMLADFMWETDAGYIDEQVITPLPPDQWERKFSQPVAYIREPDSDVVCVNLSLLGERTMRPLLSRAPWEFEEELRQFKCRWARERGVNCWFVNNDAT